LQNLALNFKWYYRFASLYRTKVAYLAVGRIRGDDNTQEKILRIPNENFEPNGVKETLQEIVAFLMAYSTDPADHPENMAIWKTFILTF
jgi:hypothetical protein